MTRLFCLVLLGAAAPWSAAAAAQRVERGSLQFDDVPPIAAATAQRVESYLSAREAAALGWTAQGQLLISTRFGDTTQLHLVERAGGARRQLTFEREPVLTGAFSPDPARSGFLYFEDSGGDQRFQLYY